MRADPGSTLAADKGGVSSALAPRWRLRRCHLNLRWFAKTPEQDIPPTSSSGDELLYRLAGAVCPGDLKIVEVDAAFNAEAEVVLGSPALGEPEQRMRRRTRSNIDREAWFRRPVTSARGAVKKLPAVHGIPAAERRKE